ncbi:hypothetical protein Bhyg_12238 [Pseudolycoriella hygida]|uniref:Uncharacterized protein n=1 Tax=Pseudolycoriella hygida TaxID=35572 RepID=A0A9Q0MZ70_9DIPT|nr:hypothetical protein Bhyg_12238 [Pseudolycoriella hygida]
MSMSDEERAALNELSSEQLKRSFLKPTLVGQRDSKNIFKPSVLSPEKHQPSSSTNLFDQLTSQTDPKTSDNWKLGDGDCLNSSGAFGYSEIKKTPRNVQSSYTTFRPTSRTDFSYKFHKPKRQMKFYQEVGGVKRKDQKVQFCPEVPSRQARYSSNSRHSDWNNFEIPKSCQAVKSFETPKIIPEEQNLTNPTFGMSQFGSNFPQNPQPNFETSSTPLTQQPFSPIGSIGMPQNPNVNNSIQNPQLNFKVRHAGIGIVELSIFGKWLYNLAQVATNVVNPLNFKFDEKLKNDNQQKGSNKQEINYTNSHSESDKFKCRVCESTSQHKLEDSTLQVNNNNLFRELKSHPYITSGAVHK